MNKRQQRVNGHSAACIKRKVTEEKPGELSKLFGNEKNFQLIKSLMDQATSNR
jgi:hypothetical protein